MEVTAASSRASHVAVPLNVANQPPCGALGFTECQYVEKMQPWKEVALPLLWKGKCRLDPGLGASKC